MTGHAPSEEGMSVPDPVPSSPGKRLAALVRWLGRGPAQEGLTDRQARHLRDQLAGILYDLEHQEVADAAARADRLPELETAAAETAAGAEARANASMSEAGPGGERDETWLGECEQAARLEELGVEERVGRIYRLFLEYFGGFDRQLSRHEAEQLRVWLKECPHALVYLAILRAVNRGSISLAYVDRILFNWSKQGVRSVADAKERDAAFRASRETGGGGDTRGKAGRHTNGRFGQHPGETRSDFENDDLW